jgi:hypothetical protein
LSNYFIFLNGTLYFCLWGTCSALGLFVQNEAKYQRTCAEMKCEFRKGTRIGSVSKKSFFTGKKFSVKTVQLAVCAAAAGRLEKKKEKREKKVVVGGAQLMICAFLLSPVFPVAEASEACRPFYIGLAGCTRA